MVISQFLKVKCDNCGKEVEIKGEFRRIPDGWFTIEITRWRDNMGKVYFGKDALCSKKCVMGILETAKLKKPKDIPIRI